MDNYDKYLDFLDGKKQEDSPNKEEEKVSEATLKEADSPQNNKEEETIVNPQPANQNRNKVKTSVPENNKTDKEGDNIQAQVLGMDLPKMSEDVQKNVKAYTTFLTSIQERMKTPEFQELVKKRAECFSPENERLYMGYLLMRGYVTEEQARDYLKKMIPHDENTPESAFEPTDLKQFDKQ